MNSACCARQGLEAFCLLACLLVCLLGLAACGEAEPWRHEAYVFGTRVEVLVTGLPEDAASAAAQKVLREFDRLHRLYHPWQPSELSALNEALAAGRSQEVSQELADFIHQAQDLTRQSEGLFDPGIGKLIGLWGFQNDEPRATLPDPAALTALQAQRPSILALKLDGRRVSSASRAVGLDFGGYLKGVALDRAAALLRANGVRSALINIGGNVIALGDRHGTPWRVGIQHPRPAESGGEPMATLDLRDGEAIGTSGDYQRFFEVDGQRYCHLIDPRTGRPATGTRAVTVLIPAGRDAGMRSDALSKPVFIGGSDWQRPAVRLGVKNVLRVDDTGRVFVSPGMAERLRFGQSTLPIQIIDPFAEGSAWSHSTEPRSAPAFSLTATSS